METALMKNTEAQLYDKSEIEVVDRLLDQLRPQLAERQVLLAEHLATGMPKKVAMIKAGYESSGARYCNDILAARGGIVQDFLSLLQKREGLTNAVNKRWVTNKLVWVIEEAQERGELKTVVAAACEINKMAGHHAPVNVKVDGKVSVSYEFLGFDTGTPQIKESMVQGEIIEAAGVSLVEEPPAPSETKIQDTAQNAAIEFGNYPMEKDYE